MQKRSPKSNGINDFDPAKDWQERSEFWLKSYRKKSPFRRVRERNRRPLILTGQGVSLNVEHNSLIVRNGFTYHPQSQETLRFFPGDLTLPPRILFLNCSGSISFHVLRWLKSQSIDLVHLNWDGEIVATTSYSGYAANYENAFWQRVTRQFPEKRLKFGISLIAKKLELSLVTLAHLNFRNDAWQRAIEFLEISRKALLGDPPETIADLLVIEANCANAYFRAWRGLILAWKGTSRKAIPESWYVYDRRVSTNSQTGNRRANHPVNALLNYAYKVSEGELLIQAISEGFDPTLGIVHESGPNRYAFLYDLIEMERAQIDHEIFHFVRSTVFSPGDFAIEHDGTVILNPQMARYVTGIVCSLPRPTIEGRLVRS